MLRCHQTRSFAFAPLLTSAILLVVAPTLAIAAPTVSIVESKNAKTAHSEELTSTTVFEVSGLTPAKLDRCIARGTTYLARKRTPTKNFGWVHWNKREVETLKTCNAKKCLYDFSPKRVLEIDQHKDLAARKKAYYAMLVQSALSVDKKRKRNRIKAWTLRNEPCGKHNAFHWLLNGKLKSHDPIVWRKMYRKRLFPTILIMQSSKWKAGSAYCRGRTMLFADHYYRDHLELYQFWPTGPNKLMLRFHVRSRLPLGNWWRRRFRGLIAKRMRRFEVLRVAKMLYKCK